MKKILPILGVVAGAAAFVAYKMKKEEQKQIIDLDQGLLEDEEETLEEGPISDPASCCENVMEKAEEVKENVEEKAKNLEERTEELMALASLAVEHEISVSHLQKLFKQVYGVPIYRYIKEYRLEQAAVELVRSGKSVTEIAQQAGYDNASKFSESFKKRYGKTPSRYRADAKKKAKQSSETKME